MKHMLMLWSCSLLLLAAVGCSGSKNLAEEQTDRQNSIGGAVDASSAVVDKASLLHRRFVLQTVNGQDYSVKERVPELEFLEGFRVAGRICNRFTGQGELDKGTLSAKQLISTKMLCVDADLNTLEYRFAELLQSGAALHLDASGLTLKGEVRGEPMELVYKTADWVR